ncbi:MAG: hypothetical protein ACE5IW_01485 [bacterium]
MIGGRCSKPTKGNGVVSYQGGISGFGAVILAQTIFHAAVRSLVRAPLNDDRIGAVTGCTWSRRDHRGSGIRLYL